MYYYNTANPWGNQPVNPYVSNSEQGGGPGYYYDKERGVYLDEDAYNERTNGGQRPVGDPNRFEWVPMEEVDQENSPYALEQKQNVAMNEMFPDIQGFAEESLGAERETLPFETAANIAGYQYSSDVLPVKAKADIAGYQNTLDTMPFKTAADIAGYKYSSDVLPVKAATDIAGLQEQKQAIQYRKPVMKKYFDEVMNGVDPDEYANTAGQEAAHQIQTNKGIMTRNMRALGVDPSSGVMANAMEEYGMNRAKAIASARTLGRQQAKAINFDRLQGAMGGVT